MNIKTGHVAQVQSPAIYILPSLCLRRQAGRNKEKNNEVTGF